MKRFLVVVSVLCIAVSLHGGKMRNYRFSSDMKPIADIPYHQEIIVKSLLFDGFSATFAILNGMEKYEVEKFFNFELQKQFMKNSVQLYDYKVVNGYKTALDEKSQQGTLTMDSVNNSKFIFYTINPLTDEKFVLSGAIEYFKFNREFEQSFIVLSLKFFEKDTGKQFWMTTIKGKVGDVIDYIIDALAHQPIDKSISLKAIVKKQAEEDFANRLPEIKLDIGSADVVVKDETKLPDVDLKVKIESRYDIKKWEITIIDATTNEIKKYEGEGEPPSSTKWDLLDNNGSPVPFDADYTVVVTVEDEQKNKVSLPQVLRINKFVEPAK